VEFTARSNDSRHLISCIGLNSMRWPWSSVLQWTWLERCTHCAKWATTSMQWVAPKQMTRTHRSTNASGWILRLWGGLR
jgi:hypothetical protein